MATASTGRFPLSARYDYKDGKYFLHLHVQTGSNKDAIGECYGERVRIRIKARPVDGKANKCLIAYLAEKFAVSKSKVCILSGLHNRDLTVSIEDSNKPPDWLRKSGQEKGSQ